MSNEWYSDSVIANGIRIHFYRTGGDKPPLVLAHGITDNGLCWTQLARVLEENYDVIMYDARGHGLSDAPEQDYADVTQAADLAELIQALELGKPDVIGHSLGAVTASVAAANHPDLVHSVVLEDPPWYSSRLGESPQDRAANAQEWRSQNLQRKSMSRQELIAVCRSENARWSEDECRPWADAKLQVSPNVFKVMEVAWTPWKQVVSRIRCPVLLITGTPSEGALVTPEAAREAAGAWQDGKVVHIDGVGHCIRREAPEQYVALVTGFLAQVHGG
jgi:pimeloyl-ACP methyl ester carboxylesterase